MPDLRSRWPLRARERELESFAEAWSSRRVRTVLVWGPAGVGKTRLAEEFVDHAVRAGYSAGRATATAAAAAVPLGALAHLLPPGVDLADPVAGFAEVARVLAGRRPGARRTVLHIDDLHLLDAASAVLLRQLVDAGLVRLVGTIRSGTPVSDAVTALAGGDSVLRLDLATFHPRQVEAVLSAALEAPVAGRAVRELHRASGGNALFLRELVIGATRDGSLGFDGEIWQLDEDRRPGTPQLTDLIEGRLAAAPRSARPLLETLALCEPLGLADVQALADQELLGDLEEAGLISVTMDGPHTAVGLAHPLFGQVLSAGIPQLRRRELLLAQIDRVRSRPGAGPDDDRRTAAWQLAATGSADPDLLVAAATTAKYAQDNRQALALLEAVPGPAHTTRTRLLLGEVLLELGLPQQAEPVLAAAEAAARDEDEVLAVVVTRLYRLMLWSDGTTREATALIEAARRLVHSPRARATLRDAEGAIRIMTGDVVGGVALLDTLAEDIGQAPDPVVWLSATITKALALTLMGHGGAGLKVADQVHAAAAAAEAAAAAAGPSPETPETPAPPKEGELFIVSLAQWTRGHLDEARTAGERCYDELTAAHTPVQRTLAAANLGQIEWLAGHVAPARRWFAEATALARRHHNVRLLRSTLSGLAACAAVLGDLDAADRAVTAAADHAPSGFGAGWEHLGAAWLAAAQGDPIQARAVLTEAADQARATGLAVAEAVVLADIARLGAADEVTTRLAELAGLCDGELIPALSALAAALAAGDPALLSASAHGLRDIGAHLLAAETATAAAEAWRRLGDSREETAAQRLADTCAAHCPGARTPLLAGLSRASGLTARQRDIALMAANGASSKDIAEALHLSVRTVDSHLYSIYGKLGVRNRRDLAGALGIRRQRRSARSDG